MPTQANPVLKIGVKSADVTRLQTALKSLGYATVTDGDFGSQTEGHVKMFQNSRNLKPDGIVGTWTWAALLASAPAEMPNDPAGRDVPRDTHTVALPNTADKLELAGRAAIAEALRMWSLDIIDPPKGSHAPRAADSLRVINEILDASGWSWAGPYRGNGAPQWCGLFAATCWRKAGLDPAWPATFWASTLRLANYHRYKSWNGTSAGQRPATGARMAIDCSSVHSVADLKFSDGTTPRAGDIVIVGDGEPDEGDHITLLASIDATTGALKTLSGNGGGIGPQGNRREGIVKTDFYLDRGGFRVLWIIRPGLADLV